MCRAATSYSRTASAAQTHESMPPLRRTIARLVGRVMNRCQAHSGAEAFPKKKGFIAALKALRHPKSHSLYRRVPNKFVQLKTKTCRYIVGEHPLGQFLG